MSSVPKAPALPPPPPPPPPSQRGRNGPLLESGSHNGNGKQEDIDHGSCDCEGSKGLGQTEIREITEEKFVTEVCELMSRRLVRNDRNGNGEPDADADLVKLVVTVPLKKAILQSGPMCGIVALTEALHILNEDVASPKEILEEAIKMGYTKQGEMFSVTSMLALAEKFGKCRNSKILKTDADKDPGHFTEVISHILEGCPILVPYDADYNHSPSLRKGHAAHWAVIYGLACHIPREKSELIMNKIPEVFSALHTSQEMIIVKPTFTIRKENASSFPKELLDLLNYESLHVIAHQGKSFHTALWEYKSLMESNRNLKEIAPKLLTNKSEYICEDIIDGLCSKILLLK